MRKQGAWLALVLAALCAVGGCGPGEKDGSDGSDRSDRSVGSETSATPAETTPAADDPDAETSATPEQTEEPGEVSGGEREPMRVKVGQDFQITLAGNPTTGYEWRISEPYDKAVLLLVRSYFKASQSDRVGAGGLHLWNFRALTTGETTIELEYVRPWEQGTAPAKRETFRVVVE